LREDRKQRVFANMVLMRIFGARRNEVSEDLKRLHNENVNEFNLTQYCAGDKIDKNEVGWSLGAYGR